MSSVVENTGVNSAVEKLQELGERMRLDDFGFKDNDINNLDKIVEALYELEEDRKLVFEKLETETIKASILRHDLKILPGKIRDEIMVAVNAARQSNSDTLKDLNEKLEQMNKNILDLETRSRELERENAILHPERELLKQQHEEIIAQLNQKMADKATMQIALNETRDKVRQANQDIVDLEDGILQLKEDLIQERTEARHEKKRLKKAVMRVVDAEFIPVLQQIRVKRRELDSQNTIDNTTDTQTKTKEQKEQNVEKKRELDTHQERLVDSEGRLDSIRKSIRRYEASRSKLEADERVLSSQLAKQMEMNETLLQKGNDIMAETVREQDEFEAKLKAMTSKISTYENDIKKEMDRSSKLDQRRIQLYHDLKDKERIKEEDSLYVGELDEQLQSVKRNLTEKAEDVGHMQSENIEMTEKIEALAESHKAVLSQLNKQIEEYREQLTKERKERLELQESKDEVGKSLDDIKTNQQMFMSGMTDVIQEGKKKHVQLSNEGVALQKDIKEAESEISDMSNKLDAVQTKYQQMFSAMQHKVDNMESEILAMEKDIGDKKNFIAERTPIFQDLEAFFTNRSEEYDSVKKNIVVLKNKKMGLEDAIKRAKKDRDGLKAPQEALKNELKNNRSAVMNQIKTQGNETQEIEQQIFVVGCQLRMVMEENKKFERACKTLEKELSELENQRQENEKIKMMAQNDLVREKSDLVRKWKADNMMQEFFASRDEATAEAFGRLLNKTEKRETKIDEITLKLRDELEVLSDFLDNIASRRQEETSRGPKSLGRSESKLSTFPLGTTSNRTFSPHHDSPSRIISRLSQAKSAELRHSPDSMRTSRSFQHDGESEIGSRRKQRSPLNKFNSSPISHFLTPIRK